MFADLHSLGRWLLILGVILAGVGGALLLAEKAGISIGRLPGDIHFEGQNISCFFPIGTSIVLSILLTIVLNLVIRWLNR